MSTGKDNNNPKPTATEEKHEQAELTSKQFGSFTVTVNCDHTTSEPQLTVSRVEHKSFIPEAQHSNLILMTALEVEEPISEKLTTIIIGTVTGNYTNDLWKANKDHWEERLIKNQSNYLEICMSDGAVDDASINHDAITKTEEALTLINKLPHQGKIRVIVLGTGQSFLFFDTLTYLLREWQDDDHTPRSDKYMQLITSGDTEDHSLNNFCQWLCLSGICDNIEFYNMMHYQPYGFCSQEYAAHKQHWSAGLHS